MILNLDEPWLQTPLSYLRIAPILRQLQPSRNSAPRLLNPVTVVIRYYYRYYHRAGMFRSVRTLYQWMRHTKNIVYISRSLHDEGITFLVPSKYCIILIRGTQCIALHRESLFSVYEYVGIITTLKWEPSDASALVKIAKRVR